MSFKTFDLASDVASIVSAINEVVSVSSSISAQDANVKKFNNIASSSLEKQGGYWQTVYDSAPSNASSTALFDVTYGYSTGSAYNVPVTVSSSQNEKIKIYRHFASMLLGNPDSTFIVQGAERKELFFMTLKRSIQKDEIKKGTTSFIFQQTSGWVTASDVGAATKFKQTVGGDYAPLLSGSKEVGQSWYNTGVFVLIPATVGSPNNDIWSLTTTWSGSKTLENIQYSGSIDNCVDGLRKRLRVSTVHNQTNLYSTVYFCRATNSEFNYSSNPTFVDADKRIRVTSGSNILQTRSYITTIGLYDANDNLLAVAKVNKPITKSPDNESIFRVRLDY